MIRIGLISTVLALCLAVPLPALAFESYSHLGVREQTHLRKPGTTEMRHCVRGQRAKAIRHSLRQHYGNSAHVVQNGRKNRAGIAQKGQGHLAVIGQNGNRNKAHVRQRGRNHAAGIFQYGDGGNTRINQRGRGSSCIVTVYPESMIAR